MITIITGTPCTGKTLLAKAIAKETNHKYIDVNEIIDNNNLKESYDKERDTYVVDEKKLSKVLIDLIKENKDLIIDSHMSHEIPPKYVDKCIVTKCNLKILKERLEKRGYKENKVKENLEAEILDICFNEASELGHKPITIDTSKKSPEDLAKTI